MCRLLLTKPSSIAASHGRYTFGCALGSDTCSSFAVLPSAKSCSSSQRSSREIGAGGPSACLGSHT